MNDITDENFKDNESCNDDGIARIKERYVVPIEKLIKQKEESGNGTSENIEDQNNDNSYVNKKRKAGRNNKRPRLIKEPPSKKLCRSYWCLKPGEIPSTDKCSFQNCVFSHDVQAYLENKPEDIGEQCHNFNTYGFCNYGIICRFGKNHIKDGGSIVDEARFETYISNPPVKNILNKELQHKLRKKKYVFRTDSAQAEKDNSTDAAKTLSSGLEKSVNETDAGNKSLNGDKPDVSMKPENEESCVPFNTREKRKVDWKDKLYLAPLTTLGNLPFRRVCKRLGADITCGEMAVATSLLQGSSSEWALLKRHSSEDCFGVQLCGNNARILTKCAELLENEIEIDFVDVNMGCPIDLIFNQGAGSALMRRANAVTQIVKGMSSVLSCPVTLKMRTGVYKDTLVAHNIIEKVKIWDVDAITLHGRSKEQRYLKSANWEYIKRCAAIADPIPLFGNGDVLTYDDYIRSKEQSNVAGIMLARGALIKPWLFTEIKERRTWDISSSERFDLLKEYTNHGLEHWGSDTEGIEKTRRFLLEWLSFLYRYIPVGILERPQKINQRPPVYVGRDDLETLMASKNVQDWIKISEMVLGPVPSDFAFLPKHKANSWS